MNDVSLVLSALAQGDTKAGEKLLPLVYEELRRLAAARLSNEPPGQTLQATALVHEAYLRVAGPEQPEAWSGRAHFFGAAAEAMRRILVENARRKHALKRGGHAIRSDVPLDQIVVPEPDDELLAVNEVLDEFSRQDPQAAELVKLRYFSGLTMPEAATAMGIPLRATERLWTYAKAWLFRRLTPPEPSDHNS
jgi:RNA polymerase sigma factor (TIGR02999 family)